MFEIFSKEYRDLKRQKKEMYFSKLFFYWRDFGLSIGDARKKAKKYVNWAYKNELELV